MKVLTINTYGGSLLLGARALGADIIGSYEDVGFGSDVQAANFPGVPLVRAHADWPTQDLSDVIVLAHPPCSAFSIQNTTGDYQDRRGIDSEAFACTRRVLDYAMSNRAAAVAVESVIGALAGAYWVHEKYARQHGYRIYRVLQSGVLFSAQWRDRFWAVFVRNDLSSGQLSLRLCANRRVIQQVISGCEDGEAPYGRDKQLEQTKDRLRPHFSVEKLRLIFDAQPDPHEGPLANIIWKTLQERVGYSKKDVMNRELLGFTFLTSGLHFIHPYRRAPGLMGPSWWYINGRNLSEAGYKRIMGFPADYVFPNRRKMTTFLSKGVIPQVASWVLGQVASHIGHTHNPGCICQGCTGSEEPYILEIPAGEIADFRIKRVDWTKDRPALRHEEEA